MKLENIIKNFGNTNVLVIGDVMLDKNEIGSVKRVSPEAPVPVVLLKKKEYSIGGAANVANNIASLGGKVSLVGVIGNDEYGKVLSEEIKKQGINFYDFKDNRKTTLKRRIFGNNQQICRIDEETDKKINNYLEEDIIDLVKKKIKEFDILILSDYNKGVLTERLTKDVIEIVNSEHKKVIVAPKRIEPSLGHFIESYLVCVNKHEAQNITGITYENGNNKSLLKSLKSMGEKLVEIAKSEYAVITCGEDGMFSYSIIGNYDHVPTIALQVSDVTGAGDTVLATLALAINSKLNIHNASKLANYAAGIKVQKSGVQPVTKKELIKYVKSL